MSTTVSHGQLAKIRPAVQYYPHQISGVRDLCRRTNFLLGDDMGLGKSLQALTVAAVDFETGRARRVLVISPASLKWNWQAEIEEHTLFRCMVLEGTPLQRSRRLADFVSTEREVLIVNYEQVQTHLHELNALEFDIAIYDEAHYLKSPKAKRTRAAQGIRAKRHFLLTGSPLLNRVDELWSLLYRIDPNEYPNYWTFLSRYAVYGGYKDKQVVGVKNQAELTERVQRVMVRRLKKDVLDLPDKQRIKVLVDLHPEQARLYKQAMDELVIDVPNSPTPMEIENALTKFLRLKQICGTTATIPGHKDQSYKLDRAVEMAQEITGNGESVVLFTQFREINACMVRRLQAVGVPAYELHGDVPQRDRVALVQRWGHHPEPAALVAGLQVAGVGLNMTAASKCIFLDKLFVPKLNEQAEDRLHRIGADKTKPVQIFELIARKTIEQRIEMILRRKEKLFGTLVDQTDFKRALYEYLKEGDDDEEAA